MGLKETKTGKLLYHLTELNNLDSILKNGLVSRKIVKTNNMEFSDIADNEIISKRKQLGLEKYVPFHFHPYSAFDVAVKSNNNKKEFIYICIKRDLAKFNEFKILPKHPLTGEKCEIFEYDKGFDEIDWDIMHTVGNNDKYSKNVKMAECLTELVIPAKYFQCIFVRNQEIKKLVKEKIDYSGIKDNPPYVNIQEKWFE